MTVIADDADDEDKVADDSVDDDDDVDDDELIISCYHANALSVPSRSRFKVLRTPAAGRGVLSVETFRCLGRLTRIFRGARK